MTCYYHTEEQAQSAWNERLYFKDHEIRELVDELTHIAKKFGGAQSLRDGISRIVLNYLKPDKG